MIKIFQKFADAKGRAFVRWFGGQRLPTFSGGVGIGDDGFLGDDCIFGVIVTHIAAPFCGAEQLWLLAFLFEQRAAALRAFLLCGLIP